MNRADFIAAAAAASAAPRAQYRPGVAAEITIARDATALLAPFSVAIAVRNATGHSVALDFPTADMYRIDVRRDDTTVWSTASGHKPLQIARRVDVAPGLTRLANHIIDGTTDDHRAYAPGRYTVRVAMLGSTLDTTLERAIEFAPPTPIASALAAKSGTVVTLAGEPALEAGRPSLKDESGTIPLSRALGLHPRGTYVVRGYLDALGDGIVFTVGRFAPAFQNDGQTRPS